MYYLKKHFLSVIVLSHVAEIGIHWNTIAKLPARADTTMSMIAPHPNQRILLVGKTRMRKSMMLILIDATTDHVGRVRNIDDLIVEMRQFQLETS